MGDRPRDRKQRLSPARRALLEQRLKGNRKKSTTNVEQAASATGPVPATPMQRLLWAFAQINPESAAYHMHRAVRLTGPLEVVALQRALDRMVARHDALRTVFALRDRELIQQAHPSCDVPITEEPCSRETSIVLATAALRRPFDLATGPLVRAYVFAESPTQCVFLLVVHHIVADEWSLGIMWRELCEFYSGVTELPAPSIQFTEFARQRQSPTGLSQVDHTPFWVERLRGLDFRLEFPVDHSRPAVPRFRGAFLRKALPPASGKRVQALAVAEKTTPFAVLLALYGVLLSRWTGRTDLCLGIPAANRVEPARLTAVGLFLGAMPFRLQVESSASFRTHLRQASEQLIATLGHQEIQQEPLARALAIPRESGRAPLFQTMFVAEAEALATGDLAGLVAERIELDYGAAKFDTSFFVNATADPPSLAIEYDTDLFEKATAERLLDAYGWLLEQVLADPERPLDALSLIRDDERACLLEGFGRGPALTEEGVDVLTRIRNTAEARPNRAAVRCGGQTTNYRELIDAAAALAHRLRAAGAGPDQPIGLYLGRSTTMVVGVLAGLMANAAYVPLDPSYPRQRLQFALDDLTTAAGDEPIVVAEADGRDALGSGVRIVELCDATADRSDVAAPPPDTAPTLNDEQLAYVIYTSGSTGRPKGVAVTRANLAASTAARIQTYATTERFLLLPSFAFDSSVAGLFWTLATGGTLVIAGSDDSRDPREIARLICDERVTHTLLLPSLWQFVLKTHGPGELETLRAVVVAGEACSEELVREHHALLGGVALYNEYGPTEATVWSTVHSCAPDERGRVPIGRPIPGGRAYVLDMLGQPCPIGFAGELHVGGPGIAQGYWHRADTAARFATDPFDGKAAEGRLYRTGDRARFRADGSLEFLGRTDDQIKVRGHRIEPGEVETCLATHPTVDAAGVAPHPADPNRLVALVRIAAGGELDPAALREHVLASLPEPMVPAAFVSVVELPHLANGKLDRRRVTELATAIRALQPRRGVDDDGVVDHEYEQGDVADPLETALSALWARALQVDRVSPEDDFFQLGGHSLLGVQLLLDVKERFGVDLALADLFETPRLRDQAVSIRDRWKPSGAARRHRRVVSPVNTSGSRPPLFCIHAPAVEISAALGDDQPVYLVFTNLSDSDEPLSSVQSIAEHYVRGLRKIQPHGPYHLFGYSFGGMLAYEMGLQFLAEGETVGTVGLMDPTLAPKRLRTFQRLDDLRRADGLTGKIRYLFDQGPGILLRRFKVNARTQEPPSREELLRMRNLRRYVELSESYTYLPSKLPCLIIVPEGHPAWLRFVHRFWNEQLGGSARMEVIAGSRVHMDLVQPRHSPDVIARFHRFLDEASARGSVAG